MIAKIKILILLVFTLTLISCSDSILNNPDTNETESSSYSNAEKLGLLGNSSTTVIKKINGQTGGVINLSGIYIASNLRIITMNAKLTIPPGAFSGYRNISLTADYQTPGIICEPGMNFNIPLSLDLSYIGLDLLSLLFNPNNVTFAYLGEDGSVVPCEYEGLDFNLLSGLLGVRKAKIEHFSRYGFSR
jgi:hypothetical protein